MSTATAIKNANANAHVVRDGRQDRSQSHSNEVNKVMDVLYNALSKYHVAPKGSREGVAHDIEEAAPGEEGVNEDARICDLVKELTQDQPASGAAKPQVQVQGTKPAQKKADADAVAAPAAAPAAAKLSAPVKKLLASNVEVTQHYPRGRGIYKAQATRRRNGNDDIAKPLGDPKKTGAASYIKAWELLHPGVSATTEVKAEPAKAFRDGYAALVRKHVVSDDQREAFLAGMAKLEDAAFRKSLNAA